MKNYRINITVIDNTHAALWSICFFCCQLLQVLRVKEKKFHGITFNCQFMQRSKTAYGVKTTSHCILLQGHLQSHQKFIFEATKSIKKIKETKKKLKKCFQTVSDLYSFKSKEYWFLKARMSLPTKKRKSKRDSLKKKQRINDID